MISSRIIRAVVATLFVLAILVLIARCLNKPEATPEVPAPLAPPPEPDVPLSSLLESRQLSAENLISRPSDPKTDTPATMLETPAVATASVSTAAADKTNAVAVPSRVSLPFVRPTAMVSETEDSLSTTNKMDAGADSLGVDLLADERGIAEMTARSYIRKSSMLSSDAANFSVSWITYAKREESPGFISESAFVDESATRINLPGLPVDNPNILARAMYYIREAEIKLKEGDAQQAMSLYTQALAAYPKMTYANKQMGRLSLMRGEYDNAIRFLKDALDADETLGDTLNELGTAYLYSGRGEDALKSFSAALEASPLSIEPLFNIGLALRTMNRLDEARAKFEEYLEADKFDARVYREMAVIDMMEGKPDEALERLHTAIALDGRWYTPQLDAVIIYTEKGALVKALELLERAMDYAPVWVIYQVYNLPALKELKLIPESIAFESALAEKARTGM